MQSGDDDGVLPYMETEDDNTKRNNNNNNNTVSLLSKNLGIWVPQIPQTLPCSYTNQYFSQDNNNNNIQFGLYNKETSPEVESYAPIQNMKQQGQNKRWYDDGGFTVPQITTFTHPPPLHSNKKSRSFW